MSRLPDSEVWGLLHGESSILDIAREITAVLRHERIDDAAIVGGIAVYLHGHRRATDNLDVGGGDVRCLFDALKRVGFEFDETGRELRKRDVPVRFVSPGNSPATLREFVHIDGIRTVSLADLIDMKLRSGVAKLTRAQDLADVIALIRVRGLTAEFAAQVSHDLRPEFRKLVAAVRADMDNDPSRKA